MSERIYLNNDWRFAGDFTAEATLPVRIPHTVKELPLHYFDEQDYQMLCKYERTLFVPDAWRDHALLLTFEGAAHDAVLYINEQKAGEHHSGYTGFTVDIGDYVLYGQDNTITVRLDTRESLNIPPFGNVIDYLTYGGIYRDVYLDIRETTYLADVFIRGEFPDGRCRAISEIEIQNPVPDLYIRQSIRPYGKKRFLSVGTVPATRGTIAFTLSNAKHWTPEQPKLYEIRTELLKEEEVLDEVITRIGFREIEFRADGFYLNGEKYKIRGLNRHQSYAYTGYAMPDSMQRLDADILKFELGLNAVRTSHYPQARSFLDRCDEIGLLVFTEIPGWQHIGDEAWKEQAVTNVREMIRENRNHPSIILWGVRINESVDDDPFYEKTNQAAHALDPSRQTGGVRCYKKGSFLEDVYTYNDFSHHGTNAGCEKKSQVTSDTGKAYLISEYNGHMYPSKAFDWEEHRLEQALRHSRVLRSVSEESDIAGSFGWCMADYNTHKDFGSGDRICYHGVLDIFRNHKLAASAYAIWQEDHPVLEVSSTMDIGEHPASNRGDVYIYTNADSVKMYKDDRFIREFTRNGHMPILIDDYIGDTLEQDESMPHAKAETIKDLLNEAARFGMDQFSRTSKARLAMLRLRYRMNMEDAYRYYNRYIGNWGGNSTAWKFEAIKDGEVVKTVVKAPMSKWGLELEPSHTILHEDKSYDVALVRIRAVDENMNLLPYANEPLLIETSGAIDLIGPNVIALQGGLGGIYVRTNGTAGPGKLLIYNAEGRKHKIEFEVLMSL